MKFVQSSNQAAYSNLQLNVLVLLRFLIGWHFLYEGVVKIMNPDWSAAAFLRDSQGLFSGLFHWMAADATLLYVVNMINMWALTIIGLCLIIGIFSRFVSYSAILLLVLYYLAAPPWPGFTESIPMHGNHLIIDKNLIELAAFLVLIVFPTSHIVGLEKFLLKWRGGQSDE